MSDRRFDLVLFGATSFVGRLTALYLREAAPAGARIALAGRSREKLEQLKRSLRVEDWPALVADSFDEGSLAQLASDTRVLTSTVGPYRRYGIPVVAACVQAGTHYADLTGEVVFMRESIDRFDEPARASGARIVHSCGFDSIPSDLGVLLIHEAASADGAGELEQTTLVVRSFRGGLSGGTFASLKGMIDGGWVGPFVMGPLNTRVVRRSNALRGWEYGRRLRYREVMGPTRAPPAARTTCAGSRPRAIPATRRPR